ncbi:MAG: 30S ribosomal protein S2 [Planctomycetia bacterium]|nr:MAG: 30S ribosomal protein S2 [Planctomycetia bacterium]
MSTPIVKELLDSGIHFGHHASRWNPKMKPYIFGKKNNIHIIDIRETIRGLLRARKLVTTVVARGDDVLFVGTKRQARDAVQQHGERCGMHYVSERWLGGTLTNFRTIRSRLNRLEELEALVASPAWETGYSKKMKSMLTRELEKILKNLSGIRRMTRVPGVLVVVDVRKEVNAVREAQSLKIPTICLIDTDSDPDLASVAIPGNDDAMRGIQLILGQLADAAEEGKRSRPPAPEPRGGGDDDRDPEREDRGRRRGGGGRRERPERSDRGGGYSEGATAPASAAVQTPPAEGGAAVAGAPPASVQG